MKARGWDLYNVPIIKLFSNSEELTLENTLVMLRRVVWAQKENEKELESSQRLQVKRNRRGGRGRNRRRGKIDAY